MSDAADAFEEALNSAEEALGERRKLTFRGEEIDAIVHEAVNDPTFTASGTAVATPIRVNVRKSDIVFPIGHLEEVGFRGKTLSILTWANLAGCIQFVIGDPAMEEQY